VLRSAVAAALRLAGPAAVPALRASDFADGLTIGPVSSEQPAAQPVAAGPAKVGLTVNSGAEVTPDRVLAGAGAADARPGATARPTGSASDNKVIRTL
jgi:hypothetical protein